MKKLVSLIGLFVVLNLPFACNPCGPFDNRPYKIVSMSSVIGSITDSLFSENILTGVESAAIKIQIDDVVQAGNIQPFWFSLSSSVHACSPPDPIVQIMSKLKISSEEGISSGGINYEPGANLNGLFKVLVSLRELSIAEFQDEFSYSFGVYNKEIYFQLIENPDNSIAQKFTFTFTFDDGLEYQVLTPVFTVD